MPELPEVERARRQLAALAGERVASVLAVDDPIVFEGVSTDVVIEALDGARVLAAARHGKQLWLELDRRPWPLFHLGMSGGFVSPGEVALPLQSGPTPSGAWPPRFAKLVLATASGRSIAFTNARRLGRVRLRDDPRSEPPVSELGFDPLLQPPSASTLRAAIGDRSVTLKGLLLDQRFAAGVGNWVADEVLHAARLDPRRPACDLQPPEHVALARALRSIVRKATDVDADADRFPKDWLFHLRWRPGDAPLTREGRPVAVDKVAGRTTVWVPSLQR